MYLIVFTRKRLAPLVRRISPLLPAVLILAVAGMTAAIIWLELRSAQLARITTELASRISGYERQLAEAPPEVPPPVAPVAGEILIDLRVPPDTALPEVDAVYAIQLASLHSRDEALRVVAGLKGALPRPLLIQRAVLANGSWHRVLMEPFPDRAGAAAFADSLRQQGMIRDYILQRLPSGWRESTDYETVPN